MQRLVDPYIRSHQKKLLLRLDVNAMVMFGDMGNVKAAYQRLNHRVSVFFACAGMVEVVSCHNVKPDSIFKIHIDAIVIMMPGRQYKACLVVLSKPESSRSSSSVQLL